MTKGILWVSSRITQPVKLSPEKFCDWYENTHIQQVLSLSGIPSAIRYQAISPQPTLETWSSDAPWLTVYEMPDLDFRHSSEFKGLDGQSVPEGEVLEGIFLGARFDTRFYGEVQVYENGNEGRDEEQRGKEDGKQKRWLISVALEPPPRADAEKDFDAWYRHEHLAFLARSPSYIRTRRYELVSGTMLNEFQRSVPEIPKFLAMHEFEGEDLPWGVLSESAKTEWAVRVMGGLAKSEVGWFEEKRVYGEGEWGSVGQ